jgi:tripartite-type tricarboxylate transporter receptor subunit TctC
MASAGVGSGPHAAGELFKMMAGVNVIHVPYGGQGPALTDLLGGQVQLYFASVPSSIPADLPHRPTRQSRAKSCSR